MWRRAVNRLRAAWSLPRVPSTMRVIREPLEFLSFESGPGPGSDPCMPFKCRVLTDKAVGGRSTARFQVEEIQESGGRMTSTITRAVFEGVLSTLRSPKDPRVRRSGYCAVKFDFVEPILIDGYEGLEIYLRTDGRTYVTNMEVESFFPDELYQGYATLPANQWLKVNLRFADMTLTRLGHVAELQREIDGRFKMESLGFLLADGKDGPFKLEVRYVRAVDKVEGKLPEEGQAALARAKEEEEAAAAVDQSSSGSRMEREGVGQEGSTGGPTTLQADRGEKASPPPSAGTKER